MMSSASTGGRHLPRLVTGRSAKRKTTEAMPRMLKAADVAERYNCSIVTARRIMDSPGFPGVTLSSATGRRKMRRVDPDRLEAFLTAQQSKNDEVA